MVAAAVDRVRRDDVLAGRLVTAGHRRLEDFQLATTRTRFVEVLTGLAEDQGGRS